MRRAVLTIGWARAESRQVCGQRVAARRGGGHRVPLRKVRIRRVCLCASVFLLSFGRVLRFTPSESSGSLAALPSARASGRVSAICLRGSRHGGRVVLRGGRSDSKLAGSATQGRRTFEATPSPAQCCRRCCPIPAHEAERPRARATPALKFHQQQAPLRCTRRPGDRLGRTRAFWRRGLGRGVAASDR